MKFCLKTAYPRQNQFRRSAAGQHSAGWVENLQKKLVCVRVYSRSLLSYIRSAIYGNNLMAQNLFLVSYI